ncbi:MAG: anthranilate phosphoribosyltransferase [Thermoanaerobaculia bacterium]
MIGGSIRKVMSGSHLSLDEMQGVFSEVMDGEVSDVQKSALLVALKMKGETPDEIAGAATAMRERVISLRVEADGLIDTCGTGGDGAGTFNISTVAAFVAAGAGARVAKHGNRAVSSSCGSADVLTALGVNINLDAEQMTSVLERTGISFLFAPKLHPAMAAMAPVRRELGVRTIFNVLGPLTNPARARRQVIGVFAPELVPILASVLRTLGAEHAMVVHSEEGLDEISISGRTRVAELRGGAIIEYELTPQEMGVIPHPIEQLRGGDATTNARIAREVLDGAQGAAREIVLANAGAALYVAGLVSGIREGVRAAAESIDSGRAASRLDALVVASSELEEAAQ